jgi:hypothetical protein
VISSQQPQQKHQIYAAPPLYSPPPPGDGRKLSSLFDSSSSLSTSLQQQQSSQQQQLPLLGGSVKEILTPGRLGDGFAVEIQIQRHGKVIRGFHQRRLVGETQDNLIVSYDSHARVNPCGPGVLVSPRSITAGPGRTPPSTGFSRVTQSPGISSSTLVGGSPTSTNTLAYPMSPGAVSGASSNPSASRLLIGELLRESGHPIHTHLIVADANREAKFVLMKRNFHQQVVIYQIVGDQRIQTSKTMKHTVFGEKAKMARCGERTNGSDSRDWAVWGKVRVGNKEVRRYLAEKQGWSLLFYDSLAALPIQDLFSLAVGLIELWEE